MKLSKILTISLAGFIALSIVVLTARQVLMNEAAEPYLAIVNAKVVNTEGEQIATAMLLKDDKVLALGSKQLVLDALPQDYAAVDMDGKIIKPAKVAVAKELDTELLAQGVTTVQVSVDSADEAKEYYWGRQHGWYDVRVQVVSEAQLEQELSDHLYFVGAEHPNRSLVGKLAKGTFADFQVLNNGKLEQTWLGGVKRFQVQ